MSTEPEPLTHRSGAKRGPRSPLGLRFQGQRQFCQQEPGQEVLLSEWPAQLKHAGHLGVWGLAGEGGTLQRVKGESGAGKDVRGPGQGSEVRG